MPRLGLSAFIYVPFGETVIKTVTVQQSITTFTTLLPSLGFTQPKWRAANHFLRPSIITLAVSHGFILLRAVVRHVLERVMWYGSEEKKRLDDAVRAKSRNNICMFRVFNDGGGGMPPLGLGVTSSTESTSTPLPLPLPPVVGEKRR
jgi:hypothetical protein